MNLLAATVTDGGVIAAGTTIPIRPGRIPAELSSVILGVRPADLDHTTPADTRPCLSGDVAVVEELGAETHAIIPVDSPRVTSDAALAATDADSEGDGSLLLDDNRVLVTARLDPRLGVRLGETLHLAIDPERIHLFEPISGAALV